jgi:hypothetical protein
VSTEVTVGEKRYRISRRGVLRVLALYDEFTDAVVDPEATIAELRKSPVPADLLTFVQTLPETSPKFDYSMEWDNLAVLEVTSWENWFKSQIHQNTRNKIRKASKSGVVTRVENFGDDLAAGLVQLFNETPVRRGRRYSYYGWNLEMVKREWATQLGRSLWLVAYHKEEMIGFIKLVVGDRVARTSGTVAKEAHRDKAPMNALFAKAVELCATGGIGWLVYGRFTYGGKGEDSLTVFKRYNGFRGVDIPRYFVPLSLRGRLGLGLRLHRPMSELVPGPMRRQLVKTRAKWHETFGRGKGPSGCHLSGSSSGKEFVNGAGLDREISPEGAKASRESASKV